jgi:D-xylose 1-dehydrogenase (NADP+, D-xylono-1,5-lactone-forming)
MNHIPLRIGILGAANIARQFTNAIRGSEKVSVECVASRTQANADAFAKELDIPRAHGTYEALLADPNIDAIYNPLPNGLHAQWSIAAAQAGKHILCEKPLAASSAEAKAMFAAAEKRGVKLVEAYPYRAQPQIIALNKMLRDHAIGNLQTMYASFGFVLTRGPDDVRWKPELAGGALMDAGSYPVSLVRMAAGARPTRVYASAKYTPSGVDSALIGSLEFANGLQAQIACSFGTARHRRAIITGDAGLIETSFYNETEGDTPTLALTRGAGPDGIDEILDFPGVSGFRRQTEAFADLVRDGWAHWPGATPEESIDIAMMLEALGRSAREGRAVTISG